MVKPCRTLTMRHTSMILSPTVMLFFTSATDRVILVIPLAAKVSLRILIEGPWWSIAYTIPESSTNLDAASAN